MKADAPISYVQDYYEKDCFRWDNFPDTSAFIDRFLTEVTGSTVLNPGCGPQFYDYMNRFGEVPKLYVGLDISQSTITYLRQSQDPRFLRARALAESGGTDFELICADIFKCEEALKGRFDCIVATGFIGTFHDDRLRMLCRLLRKALKPNGKLVKLTWHGPHRTEKQTAEKLKFGYDSLQEHKPASFLEQIESVGFKAIQHDVFRCDPSTYRWDMIQGCVFETT